MTPRPQAQNPFITRKWTGFQNFVSTAPGATYMWQVVASWIMPKPSWYEGESIFPWLEHFPHFNLKQLLPSKMGITYTPQALFFSEKTLLNQGWAWQMIREIEF